MKQQVVDNVPKRIKEVQFGIMSSQDIVKQGVTEVATRDLYDIDNNRTIKRHGALDQRMGVATKSGTCETCGQDLQKCNGHFGHVKLSLPAFHIGYMKATINMLQNICKGCARVLLQEDQRRVFLRQLRAAQDNTRKMAICKQINTLCKKAKTCPYCGSINGVVKKSGPLKISHDKFRTFNTSNSAKKVPPEEKVAFDRSFTEAKRGNVELERHLKKAMDDLDPLRVLNLFKRITATDVELLGMNPAQGRPEMFIWEYIPAPPVCIRPSVQQDGASNEDDITIKLTEIIFMSSLIRAGLQKGMPIHQLMERWEFMQAQIAMYIDSSLPSIQRQFTDLKVIRGFCQRLKGKQGRFRGNLSGKRVDFSGRTVISPDPNLSIDQVAVPIHVAKNLTYPERATKYNIEKLRRLVLNGADEYPGANFIIKKGQDFKLNLAFKKGLERNSQNLQVGDVVERHLEDGDVVLFNRQPSLHKLSILSHFAKVRPWKTFRLNECVCNPYNADFDGDEMNLHVPQTEEARTEAMVLMGVKNNLVTPRNGEPIIAAIQDFITAAYVLSSKDRFYNRQQFSQMCMYMVDGKETIDLPDPIILKPQRLWTGKQVFNVLMRPNKKSPVLVNLDAKCRDFRGAPPGHAPDMCPNDGWLVVRGSEIMCGLMDKSTVGSGKKDSIFYVILRDFGPDYTVLAMNRLAKLCARWLGTKGFSIGINDVLPGAILRAEKDKLVEKAYSECDELIVQFKEGRLEKQAGCDEETTLENKVQGILSNVRDKVGDICMKELSPNNSPLIMANSGSKGSKINVSQMVACVGQQVISGHRVPDGFQDRSLPHFPKNSKQPPSKGFVRNSFFSGLTPTEFLFHAISGREGLVDTAVKTAETGYMSRRLMKSLEDLSSNYDGTVRNSSSGIVQFKYGGDGLDPVDMEGNAQPVNFARTWYHSENIKHSNSYRCLLPYQIMNICNEVLVPLENALVREDLLGNVIPDSNVTDRTLDQQESLRAFYRSIRTFVQDRATALSVLREKFHLPPMLDGEGIGDEPDAMDVDAYYDSSAVNAVNKIMQFTEALVREFLQRCLDKYERAKVEPGTAVGAVGAQSIGEPGTQMTLKTFHFAGVASMNVTLGVPRIREIINASKNISTPIIACKLECRDDERSARIIKGRIEKTYLHDIIHYIEDVLSPDDSSVAFRIDRRRVDSLQLEVTNDDIVNAIARAKLKVNRQDIEYSGDKFRIYVREISEKDRKAKQETNINLRVQTLKRALPDVVVKGYPGAARAVVKKNDKTGDNELLVEGYGLKECMNTEGVVGTETKSNSVIEMREVLGIEAARATIIGEISYTMSEHGMDIDPRHMQLLGDVMTYKGEVYGITRFGMAKVRDSVLQLASFEKTTDHLFDAAFHMKADKVEGVSECIILGQSMKIGTGAFHVVRRLAVDEKQLKPNRLFFEEAYKKRYLGDGKAKKRKSRSRK